MCRPELALAFLRLLTAVVEGEVGEVGDAAEPPMSHLGERTPAERSALPELKAAEEPRMVRRSNMIPEIAPAGFYPILPMGGT